MSETYESILEAVRRLPAEQQQRLAKQLLEEDDHLRLVLGSLNEHEPALALLLMYYAAGLTLKQIAEELGKDPRQISHQLNSLKAKLRARMRSPVAATQKTGSGKSRRHFGAWDSGDVRSADNERIDRDLAREYGGTDRS